MSDLVHIERPRDGLSEIVLNRPDKRNAMTPEMLDQLLACVSELDADAGTRAVVLRGEGRSFCSGFDLSLCKVNSDALHELLVGLSHAVRSLRRLRVPVIVAAHDIAVAGGCALLGAADLVVTNRHAKLGYPVVKLGLSPAVNAPSLLNLMTEKHVRSRLLDHELMSGEEAKRIGLATILVDLIEDVIPRSQVEAMKLADKPPFAIAATKKWLNEIDGSLDDARFDAALKASLSLVGSEEERRLLSQLWT